MAMAAGLKGQILLALSEPKGIFGNNSWRGNPPLSRDRRHRERGKSMSLSFFTALLSRLTPTLPLTYIIYYIYKIYKKRAAERPIQARK
jgi:hypothetical protein